MDGRYRLVEKLGTGGMGEVWKGTDERLDRPIAVKLVRPDLVDTDDTVARFHREARVTARLAGHPNIVILHDYGNHDDSVYAVMELVAGRTLNAVLRERGALPIGLIADWGAQICAGLAAAHAAGIVHRDVKPGNLMLAGDGSAAGAPGTEGTVKVLDFGIAGFHEAVVQSRRLTRTGDLIGTPLYMSPEQVQCRPADVAGDLYSLGTILYQMLTGRPPFQASEPLAVLRMHLMERPRPPEELRDGIPAGLRALVLELLAKSPEQRPGSAGTVRDRLLSAAGAASGGASPPDATTVPARPAPTRRLTEPVPASLAPGRRRELIRRLDDIEARAEEGYLATAAQELRSLLHELAEVYGPEHPETLKARRRHAYLSGKGGYPAHAAELFGELVPDLERVYGRQHPETLTARYYLATNAGRAGRHAEAARVHRELLPDLVAAHGPDAGRVLLTRLHLAFDIGESGDHRRAVAMLEELVPDLERVLGPDDSTALTARHYRAAYTGYAGDPAGAARQYHELLADHVRIHGAAHAQSAKIRARLSEWQDRAR
ncbi:serine/threonine protein kinase PkaE [Spinactinospora alkalitolerans]